MSQVDKRMDTLKFDSDNSENYKFELIFDHAVYATESADPLSDLYYLVSQKS